MPASDIRCDTLYVGFVYVYNDSKQLGYVCAVCRQVFYELTDFQKDFASHDMKTSTVSLPVRASRVCPTDKDDNAELKHECVDIPLETFVDYVNQYRKNDVIQTVKRIKSESSGLQQDKQTNGNKADVSDGEVTTTAHCECHSSEENTENIKKQTQKTVINSNHRRRRKHMKRRTKACVKKLKKENDDRQQSAVQEQEHAEQDEKLPSDKDDNPNENTMASSEFQCKECPWKSDRHFNYHRHLFTHSHQRGDVGPLTCDYCKKILRSDMGKSGYGQLRVNCSMCGTGPLFQSRLIQHMIKMHNISMSPKSKKPVYHCEQCPYVTVKQTMFNKHMLQHQIPDYKPNKMVYLRTPRLKKEPKQKTATAHMCDKCPYMTNRSDLMKQHLLKHSPEDIVEYQCESCDFVAMTEKGLTIHSKVHKKQTFPCSLCPDNDIAYDEKTLAFHLEDSHNLDNQLFCGQCGWLADDQQMLASHMTEEHNHPETVYYVCYVCGVASDTKEAAKAHLDKHTDNDIQACVESKGLKKPDCPDVYSCDSCVYRTDNPLAMRRHRLIHKKRASMTFTCDTCRASFTQLSPYNAHLMNKHNVRTFSYQCKMCGKIEQCSGSLKKHVAGHLRVKEIFGCDQCNYEAGRRWNLLRHKETTHKSQVYACDHCDYSTRSVPRIADHFKHVHLVEPPVIIQEELAKESDKGASLAEIASKKRRQYVRQDQCKKRELKPQKKTMCEICGKLVINSLSEQHRNAHLGHKPFRCHYEGCQHETLTGSALAEHIRRRHLSIKRTNSAKMSTDVKYSCASDGDGQITEALLAASEDVNIVASKEETPCDTIIEEIITDGAMMLEGMPHIVMETNSDAVLDQQQISQSEDGMDVSTGESVQIPMDDNTTLLIEHFAGDAMVVPQMTSQANSSASHSLNVTDMERDQIMTTLMTEPQVTEVYMIIPTSYSNG